MAVKSYFALGLIAASALSAGTKLADVQARQHPDGHRDNQGRFRQTLPAAERFEAKVVREDCCWRWIWDGEQYGGAHRWAYAFFVGPIPADLEIDHLCRNTWCVNPGHLEPVTGSENTLRGDSPRLSSERWQTNHPGAARNRAKLHCPQGHPYDEGNTYVNSRGHRACRVCHATKERIRRQRATLLSQGIPS